MQIFYWNWPTRSFLYMYDFYEQIYRDMNPPVHPWCPYGKRPGLRDLWKNEQIKFEHMADSVLEYRDEYEK